MLVLKKTFLFMMLLAVLSLPVQAATDTWQQKLNRLHQGENVKFRIVQLGDSHTAGGFLTDELRRVLQKRWGDGGIGWIYPNQISGQRNGLVSYSSNQWPIFNSLKKDKHTVEFPIGGMVTQTLAQHNLIIRPNIGTDEPQNIQLMLKPITPAAILSIHDANGVGHVLQAFPNQHWQNFALQIRLPISVNAVDHHVWQMGLINIENMNPKGVVVSALGINGAKLAHSQNWRSQWYADLAQTEADLVILAYGTNEAFDSQMNAVQVEQYWQYVLQNIRYRLPEAGILVLGAPESLIHKTGGCGTRPANLTTMQQIQQKVAQQAGAMYWSWQDVMGGECSMKHWMAKKWAQADGVHFTPQGYHQIGARLAEAVIQMAK